MNLASCNDHSSELQNPVLFRFDSLVAESYEIYYLTNPSTTITAYATGEGLIYHWSVTAGEIFGSGHEVTYTTNPLCCGGYQTIFCVVEDVNQQGKVKEIDIYVDF